MHTKQDLSGLGTIYKRSPPIVFHQLFFFTPNLLRY